MISRCLSTGSLSASTNGSRQSQKMPPIFYPSLSNVFKLFSFCFSMAFGKICKDHVPKE